MAPVIARWISQNNLEEEQIQKAVLTGWNNFNSLALNIPILFIYWRQGILPLSIYLNHIKRLCLSRWNNISAQFSINRLINVDACLKYELPSNPSTGNISG